MIWLILCSSAQTKSALAKQSNVEKFNAAKIAELEMDNENLAKVNIATTAGFVCSAIYILYVHFRHS